MDFSTKKINGPSMMPAFSPSGLAGIVPVTRIKNNSYDCCVSIHQVVGPVIYFSMENTWYLPSDGRISKPTC